MTRIASQLTFCSPDDIRRRAVVEQNEQQTVTRLFSLDESPVESARTLFYDGILSAEIISVKEIIPDCQTLAGSYNYIDLSAGGAPKITITDKPLVLDFSTAHSVENINKLLMDHIQALSAFPIFDIIAACCYYPALIVGGTAPLEIYRQTKLLLWEGSDLVNKQLTKQTHIRIIS
jgi:hypothetical protein